MPSKKYYSIIPIVNGRSRYNVAYQHQSNYTLLYLLAKAFRYPVPLCASRSLLVDKSCLDIDTVRRLTNKALDTYLKKGRVIIDEKLLVSVGQPLVERIDTPNRLDDLELTLEIGMSNRYAVG